jgi:eukaryotic-like serine/threonine-protein kinase
LQRIVTRALMKKPEDRYAGMSEMLTDLKSFKQDLEFGEKIKRLHTTGEASRPAGTRINRRVGVAATAVVGAIVLAVAFFAGPFFGPANFESVAVLPFINATGDPELEYLSDGVTESLINALGQLPGLSVKARSMVFRYKGNEVDPQEVASTLSVEAVVNGRLERRGDRLMLSVALANGRDGDHLWGERYDSTMTDLVAVQSGMARDIAQRLHRRLSGADEQVVTQAYTSSGEAYQLYLKGRYHVQKVALPEVQTGIQYLEQATAIDPDYALAYVGLADAYRTASAADIAASQVVPKAKRAAEKAVQIDGNLSSAHTQLGMLAVWYDWDALAAERHFNRALELDPDSAEAHMFFGHLLSNQGRHEEALRESERALELEPFNSRFNALTGQFLVHAGRADEAIARLQTTIALDPNHVLARMFIATAYIEKEMYAEAIAESQFAVEKTRRRISHALAIFGYALAKSGDVVQARAVLDELVAASQSRYVSPFAVALVYNVLGERDETFAWLERGFQARDHKMNLLKVDPKWSNLHRDPRFEALVRRIGF